MADESAIVGDERYDYADAFEIRVTEPDDRPAEEIVRAALAGSPSIVRWIIRIAHRYVLRIRLGPDSSSGHILGWTIARSEPDVVALEAVSSLMRGVIVARKPDPACTVVTTFVFYRRPAVARVILKVVGPLHRRIAPFLLERGAAARPAAQRATL